MPEPIGALALVKDSDLRTLSPLGSPEVIAAVCAVNQARTVARVVEAASAGLATALGEWKGAVVVVEAGFRDEAVDAVKSWMAARAPGVPVCCVRIAGPARRSQALLGALAIAHRLGPIVCVVVDAGLTSLTPDVFGRLARPILAEAADCVSPAYTHTVAEGTLTTNLLAPMSWALYGQRIQQLLGGCAALSRRTVSRILEGDAWEGDMTDHGLEIRLAIEALTSGDQIVEVHVGRKVLDAGLAPPDVATTLVHTVGPFFRLMHRYRAVWSEITGSAAVPRVGEGATVLPDPSQVSVDRMVHAFRLGLKDLLPIWEQALQEETLASLYPLGLLAPDEFGFPVELWARVAFDFAVAYHEQRLPRDHLLRALSPLYLGRVAAFVRETRGSPPARISTTLEAIGRAFEVEKAGLAARWR